MKTLNFVPFSPNEDSLKNSVKPKNHSANGLLKNP